MSARTQVSYLSPTLSAPGPSTVRPGKLRKAERDNGGKVLPVGAGTGYGQTNDSGRLATGYVGNQGGYGNHLGPRIQASLQHAKERRKEARQGDQVSRRGNLVDEDGVAHDSEYVQFRTATPVHVHRKQTLTNGDEHPNDDDSASSSSSSNDSEGSGFPSTPYTYQSTHRTAASTHYAAPMGTTASAIPAYLQAEPRRSSFEQSSLTVPRAPSPQRRSAELDRSLYGVSKTSKKLERTPNGYTTASYQPPAKFTTSSYQPPAPAFSSRLGGGTDFNSALRLPTRVASSGSGSLAESTAQLSLADKGAAGGSGYNQYAESQRPPKLDGSALDAGVHGMKRSWDGFKLETKFAVRRMGKGVERKLRQI